MTNADSGASTMTAEAPTIDVWSFATEKNPTLDQLLAIKDVVLLHRSAKNALERKLDGLGETGQDGRNAGIARWMLAQYHRAYPLLKANGGSGATMQFLLAECCLRAEVAEGTARPMRRPDLAAKALAKHEHLWTDARIWPVYLDALLFDDNREGFLEALGKIPAAAKSSPHARYYQGRAAEFDGDYAGAVVHYEAAIQADPHHRNAIFRLAFCLDYLGEDYRAIATYEQLTRMKPLNTHALLNLGVLYEDEERYEQAISCYRTVLATFPNHRRARQYLRDAEASLGMIFDDDHDRHHDRNNAILRVPITDFELSVRARNCLAKMNIQTLGDLVSKTDAELLSYKNFGETTLQEIRALLSQKGLRLGMRLGDAARAAIVEPTIDIPDEPEAEIPTHGPVPLPEGIDPKVLSIVLGDIELSVRCRKALQTLKANTVGELLTHTEAELLALKNFGLTSLNELKAKLSEYNVSLKSS